MGENLGEDTLFLVLPFFSTDKAMASTLFSMFKIFFASFFFELDITFFFGSAGDHI
jgi:hypothetical protein